MKKHIYSFALSLLLFSGCGSTYSPSQENTTESEINTALSNDTTSQIKTNFI